MPSSSPPFNKRKGRSTDPHSAVLDQDTSNGAAVASTNSNDLYRSDLGSASVASYTPPESSSARQSNQRASSRRNSNSLDNPAKRKRIDTPATITQCSEQDHGSSIAGSEGSDSDGNYSCSAYEDSDGQTTPLTADESRPVMTPQSGRSSRVSSVKSTPPRPKPYICLYPGCEKAYSRPSRLQEHERAHTGERPFKCHELGCRAAFFREDHCITHVKSHGTQRQFQCTQSNCDKAFYSQDKLARHLKSHDEIASISLALEQDDLSEDDSRVRSRRSQSRQSSIGPETMRRIAEEITKERPYACTWEGCLKRFTKHQKLKAHVCMVHEGRKPYPCTHEGCIMSFQSPSKLRKHHLVHSDVNRYGCGVPGCETFFSKWSLLQKHNKTCHKSAPCPVCRKTVLNKTLRAHMKIHDTSRPQVICTAEGCSKVFSTERTLAAHVKTAHPAPECAPDFKCEYPGCGKTFSYKHVMERHQKRIHEEPKPRKKRRDAIEGTFMDAIVGFTADDTEAILPFACVVPGCTRRYTTEKLLQRHLTSQAHEIGDITGMDAKQSMAEAENQSIRDMIDLHIQDEN
ncbi:unnamed protein product [Mortierella alpina]